MSSPTPVPQKPDSEFHEGALQIRPLHDNLWSINVWGHHLTSDLPSIRKELQRWKRESDREYNQPTPQSQILDRAISFCDSLLEERKAPVSPEGGSSAASPERSFVARDVLSIAPTSCSDVWSLIVEPTLFTQLKNGDFPLPGPYSQIDGSLAEIRNTISSWHAHISQYPDLLSASRQGGIARALAFCELRLAEHKAPVSPEGGSAVEERSLSVSLRLEVRYDPNASVWVGHCPGMNLTSQGTTRERAFLAVEEAVLLFLKYRQGNA